SFSSAISITPCPTCSPRSIALTGRGVDKLLLVQPQTIDFGELRLAAEATRPFTVTNTSKGPVAIEAIAFSGSADLTAALDGGQPPRTLAPGETISGTARFHAQNLGAQQAQASLRASDGGPGILTMTGTGIGPVLQALPKSLFVGATALGTTRTAPVTVTNVGVDPKNVVPLVLTGVWIDGNDGTWAVQGGAMTVGPPGASVDLRVSFTPITTGMSHATLVIESNDGLHPRWRCRWRRSAGTCCPASWRSCPAIRWISARRGSSSRSSRATSWSTRPPTTASSASRRSCPARPSSAGREGSFPRAAPCLRESGCPCASSSWRRRPGRTQARCAST